MRDATASADPGTPLGGGRPIPAAPEVFAATPDACLVLADLATGEVRRWNPERAAERLSPCSTFKIPNALIGLQTGVVTGPDDLKTWDGTDKGRKPWNQDQTLASAVRVSAAWYFQDLARGHFVVRRLEARYGAEAVRLAYEGGGEPIALPPAPG